MASSERLHLRDALARLEARESEEIVEALEDLGRRLRHESLSVPDLALVERALDRASNHEAPDVRSAVASVLKHFFHSSFDGILGKLLRDENSYVCRAAERVLKHRRQTDRTDALSDQHGELLEVLLSELDRSPTSS